MCRSFGDLQRRAFTTLTKYQQQPVPVEGNLIRRAWFRMYDRLPERPHLRTVQSWDIATMVGAQNDYSVCTTWIVDKNDFYLVDVFRARLPYPALRRKVRLRRFPCR